MPMSTPISNKTAHFDPLFLLSYHSRKKADRNLKFRTDIFRSIKNVRLKIRCDLAIRMSANMEEIQF